MEPGEKLNLLVLERILGEKPDQLSATKCPRFSEDMAAAWILVEKLGPFFQIRRNGTKWFCSFDNNIYFLSRYVEANSAPEAISKAALLEVMATKEKVSL